MDKVLIWGIGSFYDNYLSKYVLNCEIEILGFITGEETICKSLDGKPIYAPDILSIIDFDYIIIATQNAYEKIEEQIVSEYKIPKDKCINGKVFKHPCFDWNRYIKIIKEKPTIITEACYGGYIYNQLGMRFYSPFINTRIFEREYIKIINNLEYYLNIDIREKRNIQSTDEMQVIISEKEISWGEKMGYPILELGDINLHAIHAKKVETYMEEWDRRKHRINWENIWVLMIIENDEMAEKFKAITHSKKIGFYYKDLRCDEIVCLKDWGNFSRRLQNGHDFLSYVHHLFYDEKLLRSIDIFKMLNGEKDFIRMK